MTAPSLAPEEEFMPDDDRLDYIDAIETVISSMAKPDSAMVSHGESGHLWKFEYGTVEVFVRLTGVSEDDIFSAWSPVLSLPARDEAGLFRKLMAANWNETFEARYAIADNRVVVVATRDIEDLSPAEISRAITIVATLADENDKPLAKEFGGA